jgi:DNA mismatch repair protein MutS
MEAFRQQHGGDYYLFGMHTWMFEPSFAEDKLKQHFGVHSAKGFGLTDMPLAQLVAGTCLHHLNENQHQHLSHIRSLKRLDSNGRIMARSSYHAAT